MGRLTRPGHLALRGRREGNGRTDHPDVLAVRKHVQQGRLSRPGCTHERRDCSRLHVAKDAVKQLPLTSALACQSPSYRTNGSRRVRDLPRDRDSVAQVLPRERLARLDQIRQVLLGLAATERGLICLQLIVERLGLCIFISEDIDLGCVGSVLELDASRCQAGGSDSNGTEHTLPTTKA